MSKEKQIESCENCLHYSACLINGEYVPTPCRAYEDKASYRKQSGWISVDERLPEESGTYITYHDHGNCGVIYYNASIHLWNVYYHEDKQNAIRSVTHWMPLPEPPDTKGGE